MIYYPASHILPFNTISQLKSNQNTRTHHNQTKWNYKNKKPKQKWHKQQKLTRPFHNSNQIRTHAHINQTKWNYKEKKKTKTKKNGINNKNVLQEEYALLLCNNLIDQAES